MPVWILKRSPTDVYLERVFVLKTIETYNEKPKATREKKIKNRFA